MTSFSPLDFTPKLQAGILKLLPVIYAQEPFHHGADKKRNGPTV